MTTRTLSSTSLNILGAVTLVCGWPFIVVSPAGAGMLLLGTHIVRSPHRKLASRAFYLMMTGLLAIVILKVCGDFGGGGEYSNWWWLFVVPYLTGWIIGIAAVVRVTSDIFSREMG